LGASSAAAGVALSTMGVDVTGTIWRNVFSAPSQSASMAAARALRVLR